MKNEFVPYDKVSLIGFDKGDYLVRYEGNLIGVVQKLVKGGWIAKSHINYRYNTSTKTRKEGVRKLIEIEDRATDEYSQNINKDDFGVWLAGSYLREIKYVHQLQNLFYSLTGQELNTKK